MLSHLIRRHPYLVIAAALILYFYPSLRMMPISSDEGSLLEGAVRVTQGQLPFRDFFEVMGPGTYYLLALVFKVFGTTWWASRLYLGLTSIALALLLYFLARRLQAGIELPVLVLSIACFPSLSISHHLDSNTWALAAFAVLVTALEKQRPARFFWAGCLAAVTACFMLPKGVLLFGSFVAVLGLLRSKQAGWMRSLSLLCSGFALTYTLLLLYFQWSGGLRDLFYALLQWPLTNYSTVNKVPYGHFLKESYGLWTNALSGLPAVVNFGVAAALTLPLAAFVALPLLLAALCLRLRRAAFTPVTLPYWMAGSALWVSEMHRMDLSHIIWGSPLLVILCFYLLVQNPGRLALPAIRLALVSSAVLALCNILISLQARTATVTPRGTVYSFRRDPVLDFTNTHVKPGGVMFFYPWSPKYYFLADLKNPTRFTNLQYHANTDDQFREVVRDLEASQVRYIVVDTQFAARARFVFPTYTAPEYASMIVEPYLDQHYKVLGEDQGMRFLERK